MSKYLNNRGRKYESELEQSGAGKKQPLSGAGWNAKHDLRTKKLLIEAKSTGALKSYSLKKKDMKAVVRNAAVTGRVGIMMLDFSGDEYVIMRREDWNAFIILEVPQQIIVNANRPDEPAPPGDA